MGRIPYSYTLHTPYSYSSKVALREIRWLETPHVAQPGRVLPHWVVSVSGSGAGPIASLLQPLLARTAGTRQCSTEVLRLCLWPSSLYCLVLQWPWRHLPTLTTCTATSTPHSTHTRPSKHPLRRPDIGCWPGLTLTGLFMTGLGCSVAHWGGHASCSGESTRKAERWRQWTGYARPTSSPAPMHVSRGIYDEQKQREEGRDKQRKYE